jgi:hypothetical protein
MTTQLWIGFGFLALLVAFLIYSVIVPPKTNNTTRATIQFLTALCAGFAGGFFTGDALFSLKGKMGGSEYAISGAAGCALFFTVWFFYPRVFPLANAFEFSIPKGWNFRSTTDKMAETISFVIDFQGFTDAELNAAVQERKVSTETVRAAIERVRLFTVTPGAVREYDVRENGSIYLLKVR